MFLISAFGALNWLLCVACLFAFFQDYRKIRSGKKVFLEASDAYDFVEHNMYMLWWLVGNALLLLGELNPFWIFGWMFLGLVIGIVVRHLFQVGGAFSFMSVGEMHLKSIAREAGKTMMRQAME